MSYIYLSESGKAVDIMQILEVSLYRNIKTCFNGWMNDEPSICFAAGEYNTRHCPGAVQQDNESLFIYFGQNVNQ